MGNILFSSFEHNLLGGCYEVNYSLPFLFMTKLDIELFLTQLCDILSVSVTYSTRPRILIDFELAFHLLRQDLLPLLPLWRFKIVSVSLGFLTKFYCALAANSLVNVAHGNPPLECIYKVLALANRISKA